MRQKSRLHLKPVELQARSAKWRPFAHWHSLSASFARKQAKQDGGWNWRLSHPPFNRHLSNCVNSPRSREVGAGRAHLLTSEGNSGRLEVCSLSWRGQTSLELPAACLPSITWETFQAGAAATNAGSSWNLSSQKVHLQVSSVTTSPPPGSPF